MLFWLASGCMSASGGMLLACAGRLLAGKKQKKKKKNTGEAAQADTRPEADLSVSLLQSRSTSAAVPGATPNSDAWREPAALRIGNDIVDIDFNPPTVTSMELHPRPIVSYPVLPLPALEYASASDCIWLWERVGHGDSAQASAEPVGCTERVYVPVEADAGCRLRITCTPASGSGPTQRIGASFQATTGEHLLHTIWSVQSAFHVAAVSTSLPWRCRRVCAMAMAIHGPGSVTVRTFAANAVADWCTVHTMLQSCFCHLHMSGNLLRSWCRIHAATRHLQAALTS